MQLIKSLHQISHETAELRLVPVPLVSASISNHLGQTGIDWLKDKDVAVRLLHLNASVRYKIILHFEQELRVQLGCRLCEVHFAENIGVHMAFLCGEGSEEERKTFAVGSSLKEPSFAQLLIAHNFIDYDIFGFGVECLFKLLVDLRFQ
jgi:hypothetical protein